MTKDSPTLSLNQAADAFLSQPAIAVIGLSRGQDDTAKTIYEKLRETGHTVFAIHPSETDVKGIPCYTDLASTPEPADAVVVVTRPSQISGILTQALNAGVSWVWLHKSFGNSVDRSAVQYGREKGLNIIDGGCPMMHLEPVDSAHKCMKPILQWMRRIPRTIPLINQ